MDRQENCEAPGLHTSRHLLRKLLRIEGARRGAEVSAAPLPSLRSQPVPPSRPGAPPEPAPWRDNARQKSRDRRGRALSGWRDIPRYRRHTRSAAPDVRAWRRPRQESQKYWRAPGVPARRSPAPDALARPSRSRRRSSQAGHQPPCRWHSLSASASRSAAALVDPTARYRLWGRAPHSVWDLWGWSPAFSVSSCHSAATPGDAGPAAAICRSAKRLSLPVSVFGSCATYSIARGYLYGAM